MDMSLNDFKYLTSTCWNEKYQPLTIDMSKDRYHGRYRLGLNSILFADSSPFSNKEKKIYSKVTEEDVIILRKLAEQQKDKIGNRTLKQTHGLK